MPLYNNNSNDIMLSYLEINEEHNHSIDKCSVNATNAPVFTASTASWAYGGYVEVIAAGAVSNPFDIHYINAGAVSDVGTYQYQLAQGTAGNESLIATGRIARLSVQSGAMSVPTQTPVLDAGTRVSMRIASNVTSSTLVASVQYHEY